MTKAKKRGSTLTGTCESCGDPPRVRVRYKGKLRVACNRCGTRVRLGGDFMRAWDKLHSRRETITPKVKKMRKAGSTFLEIARASGISVITARRWAGDA